MSKLTNNKLNYCITFRDIISGQVKGHPKKLVYYSKYQFVNVDGKETLKSILSLTNVRFSMMKCDMLD